ncbi:transglycosylase SLT domain-containing protein [Corallococcus terminator]|uniref:Lytic transglycosylase domain-containing protein n=1 Tax=Corallococcus terminator TaxID=2316733 RepID=A0A3A8INN0_9BACT|nr:transglycosylase SLT domain-containing protein [Corallococcus terminator]RKG84992.1 lytic transglycosylase domain-containing protein [Corallococcus terminator]
MSISPTRNTQSLFTRAPARTDAPGLSGLTGTPATFQPQTKVGPQVSPRLAALRQDGFDAGPGKDAQALGKLLQDTLTALNTLAQLVGGMEGMQGAQGAQGVPDLGGASDAQSFSDSSFTPQDCTSPSPVELSPSPVGPSSAQGTSTSPTDTSGTPSATGASGTPGSTGTSGTQSSTGASGATGGSKLGGNLPPGLEKFRGAIESASAKTGVPAEVLAAQIWQESRGNLEAISTNGGNGLTDTGLMQVNPNTYKELQAKHPELQGKDLSDPETNILAGACYMKDMKEQFGGSMDLALRAYNSGPNGVDKSNPDAIPAGTGDATYVQKVKSFANILATGQGTLPA